ncbi:MAG: hypothetical protein ACLQVL_28150 [Terriglobia bacterium]
MRKISDGGGDNSDGRVLETQLRAIAVLGRVGKVRNAARNQVALDV